MTTKSKLTLLISDLHLETERPDIIEAFLAFLNQHAIEAEALYILGDFFNVWIGDDKVSELSLLVASSLKQLANSGTRIYLMHGNRDFLLGDDFVSQCGASLINEPYHLECYGKRHLLIHGDSLCTRDQGFMDFRNMVRNEEWCQHFLAKTLEERQAFADHARAQSKSMNSNKSADIMDVTQSEVLKIMQEHDISSLIHGHTHRPAVHRFPLENGITGERTVLGDWEQGASYISLSGPEPELTYAGSGSNSSFQH